MPTDFARGENLINDTPAYAVEVAGVLTSYPTLTAAANVTGDGQALVLGGRMPGGFVLNTNATVRGNGAVFAGDILSQIRIGRFPVNTANQVARIENIVLNTRFGIVRQNASTLDSYIVLDGVVFNEKSWLSLYALTTNSAAVTRVKLINCRGYNTSGASVSEVPGGGSVVFQGRNDVLQVMELTIGAGCYFESTVGSIFGGSAHASTRVILEDDAKVIPAPGYALNTVTIGPGGAAHTALVVDNRSMVVRKPLTGEAGYAWTATGAGTGNWLPQTGSSATTAPAQVVGVSVTPGDGQLAVTCTPSAGATTYEYRSRSGGVGSYILAGTASGTSFTITGATNGTAYEVIVIARNSVGDAPPSVPVSGTPVAPVITHDIVLADIQQNSDHQTRGDGQEVFSSLAMFWCDVTGGLLDVDVRNSLPGSLGTQASVAAWADGVPSGYLLANGRITLPTTASTRVWLVFSLTSRPGDSGELQQATATRVSVPTGGTLSVVAPAPSPLVVIVTSDSTGVGVGASVPGHTAAVMQMRVAKPGYDIICVRAWGGKRIEQLVAELTDFQAAVTAIFGRPGVTRRAFFGNIVYNSKGNGRSTAQVAADWATVLDWMATAYPSVIQELSTGYVTTNDPTGFQTYGVALTALETTRQDNLSMVQAWTVVSSSNLATGDVVHFGDAGQAQQANDLLANSDLFVRQLARYDMSSVTVNGSNHLTAWNDVYGSANMVSSNTAVTPTLTSGQLVWTGNYIDATLEIPGLVNAGNNGGVSFAARLKVTPSTVSRMFLALGTTIAGQYVGLGYVCSGGTNYWGYTSFTSAINGISNADTVLGDHEVVISGHLDPLHPLDFRLYVDGVRQTQAETMFDFSSGGHTVRVLNGTAALGLGAPGFDGTMKKVQFMPRLSLAALRWAANQL